MDCIVEVSIWKDIESCVEMGGQEVVFTTPSRYVLIKQILFPLLAIETKQDSMLMIVEMKTSSRLFLMRF